MRSLPLSYIKEGSVLACNVYSRGKTLFRKGHKLTQTNIRYLKSVGVRTIPVSDQYDDTQPQYDTVSEETRNEAAKTVENVLKDYRKLTPKKHEKIRRIALKMVDEIVASHELKITTHDLRTYDDYTYRHSVNVTAIAVAIGRLMHYDKVELRKLAEGALVHDIGKMKIPDTILNKEGPLNTEERDIVRKHPIWGFEILKEKTTTSPIIWGIARQHHETIDGKGYPDKRSGDDIHPWARILSIADIWDALRSDRSYKKGWPADKVLSLLNTPEMLCQLDNKVISVINSIVVPYPTGSTVKLSNNMYGVVIKQNQKKTDLPQIRITVDDDGKKVDPDDQYVLDLEKVSFLSIIETVI